MSIKKNKGGRPKVELDSLQVRDIEILAAFLPIEKIADYLGICEKTFRNIKSRDEAVFTAYNRGVAKAHTHIGKTLLQFTQYTGEDPCQLQLKFQAAKFYAQTKGGWSIKEEKKVKLDLSDNASPMDIINKAISEIRAGNITLSEIKQLTDLAQIKQQLLSTQADQTQGLPNLSEEFILENIEKFNETMRHIKEHREQESENAK